jgi:hypothetical protein
MYRATCSQIPKLWNALANAELLMRVLTTKYKQKLEALKVYTMN